MTNTQGTNYCGQSASSEHLPVNEQTLCTLKASMESQCTYTTVHYPSAQHPTAPSSLLHLSCQKKPSPDINWKRNKFSSSSLWKEYLFVICFAYMTEIHFRIQIHLDFFSPFCFYFAGNTQGACSILKGWLDGSALHPSLQVMVHYYL